MLAAQVTDAFLKTLDTVGRDVFYLGAADPKIGLFMGTPALSKDTVLADLSPLQPGYTGYAKKSLIPGSQRRNANGDYIDAMASVTFQPTAAGGTLPETVTGYFVTALIATVETLLYAEFLDEEFTFADQFSGLNLEVQGFIRNQTVWGGLCSQC